jgi:hypothetical protein
MLFNGVLYMTQREVEASAKFGNRIAARISKGKPIRANSTLRHAMMFNGHEHAVTIASQLLGIGTDEAAKHIATLAKTKSIDIVSPHCK